MSASPGTLYVCATPIGNLEDITARVARTLREVDVIAAEDTRHTRKLTTHLGISTKLVSLNKDNERKRSSSLVETLLSGSSIALVSDSGMPGISDPGHLLIRECLDNGIEFSVLPGPSAVVAALVASGLPTDAFSFFGFLPRKKGERRKLLDGLISLDSTLVFYEAPHRVKAAIHDLFQVLGDRPAAIVRELTKVYEEVLRGSLNELTKVVDEKQLKGEMVIVVEGSGREEQAPLSDNQLLAARLLFSELLSNGEPRRAAAKSVADEFGLSSREIYSWQDRE